MNVSFKPQIAADKARDPSSKAAAQFEHLAFSSPMPEAIRALAEKNVTQTLEAYEHSKVALEARPRDPGKVHSTPWVKAL